MRRVLKWRLPVSGSQTAHGKPVLAGPDASGQLKLWVETDDAKDSEGELREYQIFGTGHVIPNGWEHFQSLVDGPYIWHVYTRLSA